MNLLLLVLLIILIVGAVPRWPYSRGWGWYPSAGFIIVLILLLVLLR